MKRVIAAIGALGLVAALAPGVSAQTVPATACPLDYICSLAATGAAPLIGAANDGHPASILGFLSFDDSGNVTANLEINANGTIHNVSGGTATCTSGTASTPGTIQVTTPNGPLTIDFVASTTFEGLELLLSNDTKEQTNGTPVTLGICRPSAAG